MLNLPLAQPILHHSLLIWGPNRQLLGAEEIVPALCAFITSIICLDHRATASILIRIIVEIVTFQVDCADLHDVV